MALPEIFCLISGALKQTKFVLQGLEVDAQRMRANMASKMPFVGRG